MRLFFAFEIPPDQARLLADSVPVPSPGAPEPGVRPVAANRMHATLRFVGSASPETLGALTAGLAAVAHDFRGRDLTVRVGGVGVFPGRRRARVLWAGLSIHAGLVELQHAIEIGCREAGLPDDPSGWHPHLTLARFSGEPPAWLDDFLDRSADLRLEPFPVRRIVLFESRTLNSGPVYAPVAEAVV